MAAIGSFQNFNQRITFDIEEGNRVVVMHEDKIIVVTMMYKQ